MDRFKAQHAGEIGELALGFGKQFGDVYSLDYMYGLVREETGGSTIETIALKNNFDFYRFTLYERSAGIYGGLALYHVTGLKYQASRHNSYPSQYYRLGSLRGLLYLGAKGQIAKNKPHQAYLESGVNDVWLINYYNNPDTLDLFEYVSLAMGYAYLF